MVKSKFTLEKLTGSHFTPQNLSEFLAEKIIQFYDFDLKKNIIWDPSCGDGNLIEALLQKLECKNFEFYGAESDFISFEKAKERFKNNMKVKILNEDFIQYQTNSFNENSLFSQNLLEEIKPNTIIANPPYIRTQVMGGTESQKFAENFNLKGRVDMYFVFLISMINFLKENGLIVVITSNRFLFTKSGESIRKYLFENLEILELYDLGDTKFFKAAVLPAILVGRKKKNPSKKNNIFYSKIYEDKNIQFPFKEITIKKDLLELASNGHSGKIKFNNTFYSINHQKVEISINPENPWTINSINKKIKQSKNKFYYIKDFLKVKVGVKTTADSVFIRNDWDTIPLDSRPEKELLYNLISSNDVTRWKLTKDSTNFKILYPYLFNESREPVNLENYPKAEKYLLSFRKQLESRKYLIDAGRKWYEIWVPHKPTDWAFPKVVFRDISEEPVFLIDDKELLVNGNCYWIPAKTQEELKILYLILGIANSKSIESYYDSNFSNKLYSGKRRYLTQYVEKFPLPYPDSSIAENIINLVKKNIKSPDKFTQEIEDLTSEFFSSF